MSCRRICRELLWQARFGELGPGSAPHLEHLSDCRSCRDELGFDRALVRQLRTALAQRVEGAGPSPEAWQGVLARMARSEERPSRLRAWSTTLVARLRVGSAMAGAGLALVLALNVEIVPVRPSDATAADPEATGAPPRPLTLADGFPQAALSAPYAVTSPDDDEDAGSRRRVVTGTVPEPEQLPLAGTTGARASEAEEPSDATGEPSAPSWQAPTIRFVASDAAHLQRDTSGTTTDEEPVTESAPSPMPPVGAPS